MRLSCFSKFLYEEYKKACNTKLTVILSYEEFYKLLLLIDYINNNLGKDDEFISFDDGVFTLDKIPFDSRLSPLLIPQSVTIDVYSKTQRDFLVREPFFEAEGFKFYYVDLVSLQDKFFNAFKGREFNRSNTLAEAKKRLTLNQVKDICFEPLFRWHIERNGINLDVDEMDALFDKYPDFARDVSLNRTDSMTIKEKVKGEDGVEIEEAVTYTKSYICDAVRTNLSRGFDEPLSAPVPVAAVPMDDMKTHYFSLSAMVTLLMQQVCLDIRTNNN